VVSPSPLIAAGLAALLREGAAAEPAVGPSLALVNGIRHLAVADHDAPAPRGDVVVLYDTLYLHEVGDAPLMRMIDTVGTRVIAVGHETRPDLGARALARGAHDLVTLGVTAAELVGVVRDVWRYARATAGPPVADRRYRPGDSAGLSDREHDVLGAITRGLSNNEVASHLGISVNSVKTHIRGAYRRIGVGTRSQAVAWCIDSGFPGADQPPLLR
jgi:DNA-binding NarL/FixJ family response regulator